MSHKKSPLLSAGFLTFNRKNEGFIFLLRWRPAALSDPE